MKRQHSLKFSVLELKSACEHIEQAIRAANEISSEDRRELTDLQIQTVKVTTAIEAMIKRNERE